MTSNIPGGNASFNAAARRAAARLEPARAVTCRRRRRRRRWTRRRRWRAAVAVAAAADAAGAAAAAFRPTRDGSRGGFGVRVIHSGVWGFASSPIVTEDEIRRITRVAVEVARASAIAKKTRRQARARAGVLR